MADLFIMYSVFMDCSVRVCTFAFWLLLLLLFCIDHCLFVCLWSGGSHDNRKLFAITWIKQVSDNIPGGRGILILFATNWINEIVSIMLSAAFPINRIVSDVYYSPCLLLDFSWIYSMCAIYAACISVCGPHNKKGYN